MKQFIRLKLNTLLESINSDSSISLYDSMLSFIEEESSIPNDVLTSFNIKDSLNKDLWDGDKLKEEIRVKLYKIAKDFFESLNLPENVKLSDVILTGSLANFNWSKFSDIDLHLVIDFSDFKESENFIEDYFKAEKTVWNNEHDIKIHGYPIEIYVQDLKADIEATAIYSVLHDKWLRKPDHKKINIDKSLIKEKVKKIVNVLDYIKELYNKKEYMKVVKTIDNFWDKLKNFRQSGLEKGGEFSIENIVYKVLRRTSFMDQLDNLRKKSYDTFMTINENNIFNQDGILLIKGSSNNGKRLYATSVKNIILLNRFKSDNSSGEPAKMAILNDNFYRIKMDGFDFKVVKVSWNGEDGLKKMLNFKNQTKSIVLNNNKTPLHWETLKFKNIGQMIARIGDQIKQIKDIDWTN